MEFSEYCVPISTSKPNPGTPPEEEAIAAASVAPRKRALTVDDVPNVFGLCYWPWSAFAKSVGPHLVSAGFQEIQTNWTLLNSKRGDIVVLPALNMTYEFDKVYQYFCDHGFVAIKYSDANASPGWVSDNFYSLRILQRALNITSFDVPRLY
eukprot:s2065_g1.t1